MALADGAERHQDPDRVLVEAALVGVRHDAGVHQRGRGVAIFLTEIGADQLLPFVTDAAQRQVEQLRNLGESAQEHFPRLPMALLEILHDLL